MNLSAFVFDHNGANIAVWATSLILARAKARVLAGLTVEESNAMALTCVNETLTPAPPEPKADSAISAKGVVIER